RCLHAAFALVVCALRAWQYLDVVGKIYPVDAWLFWKLGLLWFWMAVLSLACLSTGALLLERVLRLELPPLEAIVQSMVLGLVTFVMCMYLAGALHLYGPVFAVALPALMFGAGARSAFRLWRRYAEALRWPGRDSLFV